MSSSSTPASRQHLLLCFYADTNLFFGIVQVFLQLTDLTSDLLLDVLLGLQSAGQLHVLIGLEEDRGQRSGVRG